MVQEVTTVKEYEAAIKSPATIVDFYADWCGPCKVIKPRFEEMERKYKLIKFISVNVDKLQEVASKEGVRAMPTFLLFKNGVRVQEVVGADPNKLEQVLAASAGGSTFAGTGRKLGGSSSASGSNGGSFTQWNSDQIMIGMVAILFVYLYLSQ